jgi:hypothetical protein
MIMQEQSLFDHPVTKPKPDRAKQVESSSKETYAVLKESGKVSGDMLKVLKSLDDYSSFHSPKDPTARELHKWMHECGRCNSDPNSTKPRLSELEDEGFIVKCAPEDKRLCTAGIKAVRVFTWSLTDKGREALKVVK